MCACCSQRPCSQWFNVLSGDWKIEAAWILGLGCYLSIKSLEFSHTVHTDGCREHMLGRISGHRRPCVAGFHVLGTCQAGKPTKAEVDQLLLRAKARWSEGMGRECGVLWR